MKAGGTGAVAIILARAGSKGVPGKNHLPIAGRPCVWYTIDAAMRSGRVALVAVSTDDPLVKAEAARCGCVVIDRPRHLAGDRTTVDDAARHALAMIDCEEPLGPDHPLVILYANVPVRPKGLIDRALTMLSSMGCDSVQSYQPVGKNHPWWTARIDEHHGTVRPWEGRVLNHGVFRRQDLPPAFIPDGAVIALSRRALELQIKGCPPGPHAFFGKDRRGIINPAGSVVDIDSPVDLLVADALLRTQTVGRTPAKRKVRP